MAFYNKEINQIFKELNSNSSGLSSEIVQKNINQFGKNELDKQKKTSFFKRFLMQFKNIMIIILLISAIISPTESRKPEPICTVYSFEAETFTISIISPIIYCFTFLTLYQIY